MVLQDAVFKAIGEAVVPAGQMLVGQRHRLLRDADAAMGAAVGKGIDLPPLPRRSAISWPAIMMPLTSLSGTSWLKAAGTQ